jgi:hypothetical protein
MPRATPCAACSGQGPRKHCVTQPAPPVTGFQRWPEKSVLSTTRWLRMHLSLELGSSRAILAPRLPLAETGRSTLKSWRQPASPTFPSAMPRWRRRAWLSATRFATRGAARSCSPLAARSLQVRGLPVTNRPSSPGAARVSPSVPPATLLEALHCVLRVTQRTGARCASWWSLG